MFRPNPNDDFSYAEQRAQDQHPQSSRSRPGSNSNRMRVDPSTVAAAGIKPSSSSRRQQGSRKAQTDLSHRSHQSRIFDHNIPIRTGKRRIVSYGKSDVLLQDRSKDLAPQQHSHHNQKVSPNKFYDTNRKAANGISKARPRAVNTKFEYVNPQSRGRVISPTKAASMHKEAVYAYLREEYDPELLSRHEIKAKNTHTSDFFRPASPPSPVHRERQVEYWDHNHDIDISSKNMHAHSDRTYLTPQEKRRLENKQLGELHNKYQEQHRANPLDNRMRHQASSLPLSGSVYQGGRENEMNVSSYFRKYDHGRY